MVLMIRGDGKPHLTTTRETLDHLASRFGDQERAPLIAQLEINRRLRESHIEHENQAESHSDNSLLEAYWNAFGHKGSVLDDLAPYLTAQSGLIETLRSAAERDAVSHLLDLLEREKLANDFEQADYKEYICQLNAYKLLQLVLPPSENADEQRKVARKQFELYLHGARFGKSDLDGCVINLTSPANRISPSAQGIPLTDVRPADDFGLLSAQAFIATWTKSEQKDLQGMPLPSFPPDSTDIFCMVDLLTAIFVLEKIVKDSPANGHARMLLLRLYRMVGASRCLSLLKDGAYYPLICSTAAPSLLSQHVQQLKMRTFQQDTVLHIVSERGSSDYVAGGDKGRAMISKLLINSKGIYESTEREVRMFWNGISVEESNTVPHRFRTQWSLLLHLNHTAR